MLLILLWSGLCGYVSAKPQDPVILKIAQDGKIEINGAPIIVDLGVTIPEAIRSAQKAPPSRFFQADRRVWFTFQDLGLLVSRGNSPKDDRAGITLPAVPSAPFETVVFTGQLVLDACQIHFDPEQPLKRSGVLDALKGIPEKELRHDSDGIALTFGGTEIWFIFDAAHQLDHVHVFVRTR